MAQSFDYIIRKGNVGIGTNEPRAKLTVAGDISGSGTLRMNGDIIAYYSSDERLKDNLIPISSASYKITQIGGYEFDWNKESKDYAGHDVGVIAQEIEKVLPEVVITRQDGYKAVKYEKIIPLLVQGLKEQQEEINQLKKDLDEFRNRSIFKKLFG
jgi:hypothetical protein